MSEFDQWDGDEEESSDEPAQATSETEKLKRALAREREARKNEVRAHRLTKLQQQFPGLKPEDLEGIDPAQWDRLAPKLAGSPQSEAPSPEQQAEQVERLQRQQEEADLARAANIQGVPPKPAEAPRKIGRDEAFGLYKRNPAKYHEMRAAGLIDLGVESVDRGGGSTSFRPT